MRVLVLLMLLGIACSKSSKPEAVPPSGLAGLAQGKPIKIHEGVVDEVIERDQFDYVRIGANWFALVGASLKVGQKVKVEEQVVFDNFQSKTLNRTFPRIIFGKLVQSIQTH
ncbi:MAG: hypothetical protein WCK49_04275 [Myxococcaceae bacterium]